MSTTEQATYDVRVVIYSGEAEIGEIVRIRDRVIKTTVEKLGVECGKLIGYAIARGAEAVVWQGVRYHWSIELLTAVRATQLLLEVHRDISMARRAAN